MKKMSFGSVCLCMVILLLGKQAWPSVYQSWIHNQWVIEQLRLVLPAFNDTGWPCTCPRISQPISSITFFEEKEADAGEALDLGRLYYYLGEYQNATRILQRVPSKRWSLAEFFLGASYICLEDGKQAAMYWRDDALAWRAFQNVWRCAFAGQANRSATLYDLALFSKPEIWDGWRIGSTPIIWTYYGAASVAKARGDFTAELHWLQRVWMDNPDSAWANGWLGEYYERKGNLRQAQSYYQTAVALAPTGEPNLYIALARVSLSLGEPDLAGQFIDVLLTQVAPASQWHWDRSTELVQGNASPALCDRVRRILARMNRDQTSTAIGNNLEAMRRACSVFGETK